MEALEIKTIFTIRLAGLAIPITETVVVSWAIMLILVAVSLLLTRKMKPVPRGPQVFLEMAVDFLNKFAKEQFGPFAKHIGPYMGALFLFLLTANVIGVLTPVAVNFFGHEFIPPFMIRPPTRDINVTAALAVISILLVLVSGFAARGFKGWFSHLLHPVALMLPFNIMEYATRLISLALRLFGNILGGYVMMSMIEHMFPLLLPMAVAVYFDFFDGAVQAMIFVFLTSLYISEAVNVHHE